MATIGTQFMTIKDWAAQKDPDGSPAKIIERLQQVNPILDDIPYIEGNLDTGHQITSREVLPAPTYRRINQGILPNHGSTGQVIETAALMESETVIDVEHPGLKAGGSVFRLNEDAAQAQGFNNEVAKGLFYNSTKTSPEKYMGLTPRLDVTSGNAAASQIIKADSGASGSDQYSIWFISWDPERVFGFFPKGTEAGFKMEDMGRQRVDDRANAGAHFWAWVTRFVWRLGLGVADYRYVCRICNIDSSAWKADLSAGADIPDCMAQALATIFQPEGSQLRIYMNRATFSMYHRQLMKKGTAELLSWVLQGGRRVPSYLGIPIRVTDALIAEAVVV